MSQDMNQAGLPSGSVVNKVLIANALPVFHQEAIIRMKYVFD